MNLKQINDKIDDLKYFIRLAEDAGLSARDEYQELLRYKELRKNYKRTGKTK